MQTGDYLLIDGISVKITRTNNRFVVLDSGHRLTYEEAKRFKCSSQSENLTYTSSRRVGHSHISKQLNLL